MDADADVDPVVANDCDAHNGVREIRVGSRFPRHVLRVNISRSQVNKHPIAASQVASEAHESVALEPLAFSGGECSVYQSVRSSAERAESEIRGSAQSGAQCESILFTC